MNRGAFVGGLVAAATAGLSSRAAAAAKKTVTPYGRYRALWLVNAATGESAYDYFCVDGKTVYWPGYERLCWILRDRHVASREGYVRFDIVEIEALWEVQQSLSLHGIRRPLAITSGYRTPETNAATEGAARNSQHLYAKAVDMYVDGISMADLFNLCWQREVSGGVGYYDSHVHLDSGSRRWWTGSIILPGSRPPALTLRQQSVNFAST